MRLFPIESFAVLDAVPGISARFIGRISELNVARERQEVMTLLAPFHANFLQQEGLGSFPVVRAEQVHGNKVALVRNFLLEPIPGADGLITSTRGITLGIAVADCAPIWIVARNGTAGALLHSGRKGTELGILKEGIKELCNHASLSPADLVVVIGPCIRPACYEVDFAAEIRHQAEESGILNIYDEGVCTGCHLDRYYSYRKENGLTGRMLATLTLLPS